MYCDVCVVKEVREAVWLEKKNCTASKHAKAWVLWSEGTGVIAAAVTGEI